jgi:hypothetical protein
VSKDKHEKDIEKMFAELRTSCNKFGISIRRDYRQALNDKDDKKVEEVVESMITLIKTLTEGMAVLRNYVLTVHRLNNEDSIKDLKRICSLGEDLVKSIDLLISGEDD